MNRKNPLLPTIAVAATCLAAGLAVAAGAHMATGRLVNEGVYLKNYRPLFWEESLLSHKMDYALRSHEDNDTLFLGDSTCLMDLDPARFTQETKRTAYNLGTIGWLESDGHLQILRDYLRSHPKPKLLVYLIFPVDLTADFKTNEAFKDRFVWAYGPEMRAERGLERWPLEDRRREEFRTLVGLILRRRTRYFEREVVPGLTHPRLGELLAETRGFFANRASLPVAPFAGDLRVTPLAAARLEALLRFADEQGIRTIVRLAPMPGPVSDARKRELEDGLSRLRIERPLVLEFPPSDFGDPWHLNASGVRRLTDLVARERIHE